MSEDKEEDKSFHQLSTNQLRALRGFGGVQSIPSALSYLVMEYTECRAIVARTEKRQADWVQQFGPLPEKDQSLKVAQEKLYEVRNSLSVELGKLEDVTLATIMLSLAVGYSITATR